MIFREWIRICCSENFCQSIILQFPEYYNEWSHCSLLWEWPKWSMKAMRTFHWRHSTFLFWDFRIVNIESFFRITFFGSNKNFRHQTKVSSILSDVFLSDTVFPWRRLKSRPKILKEYEYFFPKNFYSESVFFFG